MRAYFTVALLFCCNAAIAQQQEIHRALIQRDQQSAEFAAGLRGPAQVRSLEILHTAQQREAALPLSPAPAGASQLLPYQRMRMAEERELRFAPPLVRNANPEPDFRSPLPLPAGASGGVELVP